MKKIIGIFLIIIFCFSFFSCKRADSRLINIGVEEDNLPYCFEENQSLNGAYIEIAKKIFNKAGYDNINFVAGNSDNLKEMLENGEVDCVVSKNRISGEDIVSSDSFLFTKCGFVVERGQAFDVENYNDKLKMQNIGIIKNSPESKRRTFEKTVPCNSYHDAVKKLKSKQISAFVCDYYTVSALARFDTSLRYKALEIGSLVGEDYCHKFYFKSKNADLVKNINIAVDKINIDYTCKVFESYLKK